MKVEIHKTAMMTKAEVTLACENYLALHHFIETNETLDLVALTNNEEFWIQAQIKTNETKQS